MHILVPPYGGHIAIAPVAPAERAAEVLDAAEWALATSYASRRLATFAAGRTVLRGAAAATGHPVGAVLRTARGAPALPGALRGSLSHKDDWAAAWARPRSVNDDSHIGLDLELDDPLSTDIAPHVLTPRERAELSADPQQRRQEVLVRFALKEALYKALDPFVQRFVGFHEVEVQLDTSTSGLAQATFSLPTSDGQGLIGKGFLMTLPEGPWGRTLWLAGAEVKLR